MCVGGGGGSDETMQKKNTHKETMQRSPCAQEHTHPVVHSHYGEHIQHGPEEPCLDAAGQCGVLGHSRGDVGMCQLQKHGHKGIEAFL